MNRSGVIPVESTRCSRRSRPTPSAPVAAARSAASGMETLTLTSVAVIGLTGAFGRASSMGSRWSSGSARPRRTSPFSPSIVMTSPSASVRVAVSVPTTAGTPSSRETMAAWEVIPPSSVTMPAARFIAGTMSGVVISVTMMSPAPTLSSWSSFSTTRTAPDASPGLAPRPRSSTSSLPPCSPPSAEADAPSAAPMSPGSEMVVIGRDWSM